MKKRGRWEIILSILRVLRKNGKCGKTRILQDAHLDWKMLNRHLEFLVKRQFVKSIEQSSGKNHYKFSEEGEELLRNLNEVDKLLS